MVGCPAKSIVISNERDVQGWPVTWTASCEGRMYDCAKVRRGRGHAFQCERVDQYMRR
jgi:hypothetical protein